MTSPNRIKPDCQTQWELNGVGLGGTVCGLVFLFTVTASSEESHETVHTICEKDVLVVGCNL